MIHLELAKVSDAETIHSLQVASFLPLLEKYQDHETNPANDTIERIIERLKQPSTKFYFIVAEHARIGGVRIVYDEKAQHARISPIFILPAYQGKGYGQRAMALIEGIIDAKTWQLNTILQEKGNCHFYEKMGYRRAEGARVINDKMTIISYEKQLV